MTGGRREPKLVAQSTWRAHAPFRTSEQSQIMPFNNFLANFGSIPPPANPLHPVTTPPASPQNSRTPRSPPVEPTHKRPRLQPSSPTIGPVTDVADGGNRCQPDQSGPVIDNADGGIGHQPDQEGGDQGNGDQGGAAGGEVRRWDIEKEYDSDDNSDIYVRVRTPVFFIYYLNEKIDCFIITLVSSADTFIC
jgi:hypothetical protein